MKDLFISLGGRRLFFLVAAVVLFLAALLINEFIITSTSSRYYARLIQRDIISKEKDFQQLAHDTSLLYSLINRTYNEKTLKSVIDKEKG